MRPKDKERSCLLEESLVAFDANRRALPGVDSEDARLCFLEQLVESIHRVEYVGAVKGRNLSKRRKDPNDEIFDPIRAAILHQESGDTDEAFWLVFLFVHFGKHAKAGWRYLSEVYGQLGQGHIWTWTRICEDTSAFQAWLDAHISEIKRYGVPGGFGNHRKYQSLDAYSPTGTGAAVQTYINWIRPPSTHNQLFTKHCENAEGDPRIAFDSLFHSMNSVVSFGRTARFDYLTMIGKLGFAYIEPGSTYMQGTTGPLTGARLLFQGNGEGSAKASELDQWLQELEGDLRVGMQVLEDALCNWQKSPRVFRPFRA